MTNVVRHPDAMREADELEARVAALERANALVPNLQRLICPSNDGQTYFSATPQEPYALAARDMRLGPITPTRNTWWHINYALLLGTNAAAWQRIDTYVQLMEAAGTDVTKQDADDASQGVQGLWTVHNAFIYARSITEYPFKLEAGQTYYARLMASTGSINSPNCFWYRSPSWFGGTARVVGYW